MGEDLRQERHDEELLVGILARGLSPERLVICLVGTGTSRVASRYGALVPTALFTVVIGGCGNFLIAIFERFCHVVLFYQL